MSEMRYAVKRAIYLFLLSLLGVLTLGACAPATQQLAQGGQEKATPPPESAAPPVAMVVGRDSDMYPPQDLSLIASTGRPQFINAYANW